jgi:hypothetical protein
LIIITTGSEKPAMVAAAFQGFFQQFGRPG